ncbi:alpha/beta hydrolase [Streptomyces sp. NPDC057307]|uniref:alpha/beta hydrolase n=1 Tax=Streptomyces sp. NPDC057307 TaxID=3346096 RepID=UPI00363A5E89
MNDIEELKQFVVAHAQAQAMPEERYRAVLDRIRHDDEGQSGSWAVEWSVAGTELARTGEHLEAARCFNMARFPFVDGPARQEALTNCVGSLGRWQEAYPTVERLDIELPKGRIGCWASGMSRTSPKPLVILMGGIVSIKEQWASILPLFERLGMAVVVTEMPGVGENSLLYERDSWEMLPAILDAVADRADVSRTYAACLSFSGHLALRWGATDDRLRGVVTIGAPVSDFFTDREWFGRLPRVTLDTLGHLTGVPVGSLPDLFHDWALDAALLKSLKFPVYYTASKRDEIIPPGDVRQLREHVRNLSLNEYDDVHGSPSHANEIRLWVPNSLLRMSGARNPQRALTGLLLGLMRLRGKLSRA